MEGRNCNFEIEKYIEKLHGKTHFQKKIASSKQRNLNL